MTGSVFFLTFFYAWNQCEITVQEFVVQTMARGQRPKQSRVLIRVALQTKARKLMSLFDLLLHDMHGKKIHERLQQELSGD
jgi:hypothetical protein